MPFVPALTPTQHAALVADLARGMTKVDAAKAHGVSVRTVYRAIAEPAERSTRVLKPCGTPAAYMRHRRRGERCVECWAGHARDTSN